MKELTKLSAKHHILQSSTGRGSCEREEKRERRQKQSERENKVDRLHSMSNPHASFAKVPTRNAAPRRRTKYKRQRRKLNIAGETDMLSDDDSHNHSESGFDERANQILPPAGIDDFGGPSEHLLADHTAIDVLLLEAEMKNVLSDLEAFGIADDDFGSLALTSEEEKIESDAWPTLPSTALSCRSDANLEEENIVDSHEEAKADESDNWEVLSDEDSVWTVDTFADATSYRDILLLESLTSRTFTNDGETTTLEKQGARSPSDQTKRNGNLLYFELLENTDIWTSIRDTIRTLGRGKPSTHLRR
jgi:hypothetical protein